MFDVAEVRRRFPILNQTLPKGLPVTFLDSAASAQKPQCVIDHESDVYQRYYANAYRGVYRFGAEVDDQLEASRAAVQRLLNAAHLEEIVFTAGTTMAINVVATGWGRRHLKPGDEIVLNVMEHHANFVPWQQVAQATGAKLRFVNLTPDGSLDLSHLDEVLNERTRLVTVTAMSNVLGTRPPIAEIARKAHAVGALIFVDAAQSVPHELIDVQSDGIDFLAFSGHKLYGPSGVGVLYGRRELLEEMDPLLFGGHMIDRVTLEESTWAPLPAKFEAGTLPIAQAIALRSAIEFVQELGLENIHAHEQKLLAYAHERMNEVPGMKIYGPGLGEKGAIVSFTLKGAHPEDLAQLLDRKGVFVRHGHHCTMPLHEWLGVSATVRASFALYNTTEDIDRLLDAIDFARQRLRLTQAAV